MSRGTTNSNARGSSYDRAARKWYLLNTFPSNLDQRRVPTCRCYRCGGILYYETLTVDRIVPGCQGGRYVRQNIRPACAGCNSETGGATRRRAA